MRADELLTVSRLVGVAELGSRAGRCRICAEVTTQGWAEVPSDTFTAWQQLYAGDVICEYCWAMLKDRRFRSRSWWATRDGLRFVDGDRSWWWWWLREPPEPPFACYLTAGRQKQGWVAGVRYVATSRDRYPVLTDWTDRPVWMSRSWLADVAPLADRLRQRGLSRPALRAGPSPRVVLRAHAEGWDTDLRALEAHLRDPRWEVCAYAVP